jgi:putative flippase GtrA
MIRRYPVSRYLISGVTSVVIEYVSFIFLLWATDMLLLATTISFIIGVVSGFIFHKLWSFAGDQNLQTRQQVIIYSCVAGMNLAAANGSVWFLVNRMDIHATVAKLTSMAIIACWSFALFNYVIFRRDS